ncbi:putative bidirectional sugar transporter SWEET14-like [Capsicum annuum]|nr:putative bidirectional sugar transporter SWEET14-like [Capsicum annuum]
MAHNNPLISSVVIEHCKGALQGLKSLVDVGGLEESKKLSYVGGDMFMSIPSAYSILLKARYIGAKAIPSKENGGTLIIIDMVVMDHNLKKGDGKSYETQLFFDMLMMVATSGKERSERQWAKLFSNAGFRTVEYSLLYVECLSIENAIPSVELDVDQFRTRYDVLL